MMDECISENKFIDFNEAMIRARQTACLICSGSRPFRVQVANRAFTRLTHYEQHDIEGKTLEFLHGDLSDPRNTYKVRKM